MTDQEKALVMIARTLDAHRIPYMVIGGMANALWGVPRATLDIDVTVWVEPGSTSEIIRQMGKAFRIRTGRPESFVEKTRVLPMETTEGVAIDMIFGMLSFEEEAIRRAVTNMVAGQPIRFCTAEDLVIMKIISQRPKDLDDVRAILKRRGKQIDRVYLDPRIEELARLLERPEIRSNYWNWVETD